MNKYQQADEVRRLVDERVVSRILESAGQYEISDEDMMMFEKMTPTEVLKMLKEELLDQIVYSALTIIRFEQLEGKLK